MLTLADLQKKEASLTARIKAVEAQLAELHLVPGCVDKIARRRRGLKRKYRDLSRRLDDVRAAIPLAPHVRRSFFQRLFPQLFPPKSRRRRGSGVY